MASIAENNIKKRNGFICVFVRSQFEKRGGCEGTLGNNKRRGNNRDSQPLINYYFKSSAIVISRESLGFWA